MPGACSTPTTNVLEPAPARPFAPMAAKPVGGSRKPEAGPGQGALPCVPVTIVQRNADAAAGAATLTAFPAGVVGAVVRLARFDDLSALRELERAAGESFRDIDMDAVANEEPPPLEDLLVFQRDGRAWVATDAADRPVGYLLVDVVDDTAHIEQVSVHPDHARQGLGRQLIETASAWAQGQRLTALNLTTFAEVPWNAPYYTRLGFHVVPEEDLSAGMRRIRDHEAARGLDAWPRVSMSRAVPVSNDVL